MFNDAKSWFIMVNSWWCSKFVQLSWIIFGPIFQGDPIILARTWRLVLECWSRQSLPFFVAVSYSILYCWIAGVFCESQTCPPSCSSSLHLAAAWMACLSHFSWLSFAIMTAKKSKISKPWLPSPFTNCHWLSSQDPCCEPHPVRKAGAVHHQVPCPSVSLCAPTAAATGVRVDVALAQEDRGPFGGGSCLSGPDGTRVVTLLGIYSIIFRSFQINLI